MLTEAPMAPDNPNPNDWKNPAPHPIIHVSPAAVGQLRFVISQWNK